MQFHPQIYHHYMHASLIVFLNNNDQTQNIDDNVKSNDIISNHKYEECILFL